MGKLIQIVISKSPDEVMSSVDKVFAVAGKGLEGDRYYDGLGTFSPDPPKPDFEVTLIEIESINEFVENTGLVFSAKDARRNLVTEGVNLNELVGKEFCIGEVRIKGIRLCEPCNYLAQKTYPETLKGLVHKGGLRAQILNDGFLKVGLNVIEK